MHYRPNHQDTMDDTFDIHVWMISKLLGPSGEDASPLAHYVIAANHAKMFQRLNYHSFNALLKRLNDQQTIQFFEQSYTPSPSETKSDQHFLFELQEFKKFGSELLGLIHNLKLEADNFYTRHTYMAFHKLLCALLKEYKDALKALDTLQRNKSKNISTIIDALTRVADVGTLVMLMLRGGAINKHLRVIEALLPNPTAPPLEARGDKENEEVEFIEAHPPIMPRWKICLDLLQMMIIYFDAIQTLALALKSKKNRRSWWQCRHQGLISTTLRQGRVDA